VTSGVRPRQTGNVIQRRIRIIGTSQIFPACAEASAGRESENSAFVLGAEGEFRAKYSALDMKHVVWRRRENAAGNFGDGVTL